MKIVNFGSCNIDYVYSLDHIVQVGETETSHRMEVFSGGKGLNQSIAVSRAGARIFHAGCIGEDGDMLLDVLKGSGVDVSFVKKVNEKNGHAIIQVSKKGENSIFLFPGSNEMVDVEYIDKVLESFEKNDILILQNEISNIEYIIDVACRKEMRIILNPSPFNGKISGLDLSKLYCLILNEVEAAQITGEEEPEKALSYFGENYPALKIMLTLGGEGCVYKDGDSIIRHPSFDVEAVDTTAAGDTFTGYFVAGIAKGDEPAEILKTASAAAAISVTVKGAAPSVPAADEVMKRLPSMNVKKKINP